MNLQFNKMVRFYYDYIQAIQANNVNHMIYHMNVDFMIPDFKDACSTCALPFEDEHGRLIGVAVQADRLNPDYPGLGEPACINAGVKYFIPDHDRKVMVEVRAVRKKAPRPGGYEGREQITGGNKNEVRVSELQIKNGIYTRNMG